MNAQRQQIVQEFNNMHSKDDQDSHLAGLISLHHIARRRPRKPENEERKDHCASYSYKVRLNGKDVPVCCAAFTSLHGVTPWRVRRIQNSLVTTGKSPKDMRGKHTNRPSKAPDNVRDLIRSHIASFKARTSHYSIRDNPNRKYLPEDLTIAKMHEMFIENFRLNIPYKLYWTVFTSEFNISFGYPRSDTCSICDSLEQKISSTALESDKKKLSLEKSLHLRKAEAFRQKKRMFSTQAKAGNIMCLSFDFMQNLPLPHLKTNTVFYSRQLWYNVFGVHNLGSEEVTMFTYHEGEGRKGANEVTSMLLHYLRNVGTTHNDLVLISDGCSGQNKNHVMVYFLYYLVHGFKMFDSVTYLFPMRGHSYLPNDQDFSLIELKKRKTHYVGTPEGWDKIILEARKNPSPFTLRKIEASDLFDMRTATEPLFRKYPKPALKIKSIRMIRIHKDNKHVQLRDTYTGPWRDSQVVKPAIVLPNEIILKTSFIYSHKSCQAKGCQGSHGVPGKC